MMASASVAMLAALIASPAFAQDATLKPPTAVPCFDVVLPSDQNAPAVAVMVNKCTGDTWSLNRTSATNKSGRITSIGYERFPIPERRKIQ
jgi:hypothetical protein